MISFIDDFPLPTNYDRQHVVGFKEGTLVIEKVDKKMDSGKYTCKAKRLDQRAEESVVINIKGMARNLMSLATLFMK